MDLPRARGTVPAGHALPFERLPGDRCKVLTHSCLLPAHPDETTFLLELRGGTLRRLPWPPACNRPGMLAYFDTNLGWSELLKRTAKDTQADNGLGLAAQLAYYF